jgi:succinate dehydrogenase/fumarate reductase-like Fe-S protein
MYTFSYGNPLQARDTLTAASSAGTGLENCRDCASCRAVCSGRVSIGRRIEQLKQVYA